MFDFDAGKLMIIATVALVVIGPKDLPRVLRQLGQMVNRVRRMANEFQGQFMDAMKEADLQDIRAEVAKLKDSATLDVDFDPARDIKSHLDDAMKAPADTTSATPAEASTPVMMPLTGAVSSEVEPTLSIAASGFGPAVDIPTLPEPVQAVEPVMIDAPLVPVGQPDTVQAAETSTPRKTVVMRRRIGARLEAPNGKTPAWTRSRKILPARRDSPDR